MTKAERLSAARRKKKADPGQQQKSGAAKPTYVSTDKPKKKKMKETYERSLTPLTEKAKKCWPGYEKKGTKKMFGKTYNNCVKKEEVELEAYSANPAQQAAIAIAKKKKKEDDMVAKKKKEKMYAGYEPEGETISEVKDKKGKGSGTKDACYHKVKSRYSVWPSAYASGALVKCRKVGAANWGNSSKKEDFSDWKSEFIWEDGDSLKKSTEVDELTKLRNALKTKTMDGKPLNDKQIEGIKAAITQGGNPLEEDWQKTNRQDKTDGMSKAAVKAYRRENPGSKLKTAVTKKPSSLKRGSKDAKRRKSFCSRMRGMKKRLTSAKTARDPDSRINKALRRWNC